jgi:hypothetical protein
VIYACPPHYAIEDIHSCSVHGSKVTACSHSNWDQKRSLGRHVKALLLAKRSSRETYLCELLVSTY